MSDAEHVIKYYFHKFGMKSSGPLENSSDSEGSIEPEPDNTEAGDPSNDEEDDHGSNLSQETDYDDCNYRDAKLPIINEILTALESSKSGEIT